MTSPDARLAGLDLWHIPWSIHHHERLPSNVGLNPYETTFRRRTKTPTDDDILLWLLWEEKDYSIRDGPGVSGGPIGGLAALLVELLDHPRRIAARSSSTKAGLPILGGSAPAAVTTISTRRQQQ
jgi:hypothetical protein